jgi:ubiquinone/menaquinone biosynthesis C-methylase UbiE
MSAMMQPAAVITQPLTLKLLTPGRRTGLLHIVELRFARSEEAFFVLAGDRSSDWVLNALAGATRVRVGQMVYPVFVGKATPQEHAWTLGQFLTRYGTRIVDNWYARAELCLKLRPAGPSTQRNAARGEMDAKLDFESWKSVGNNYLATVQKAFDSASEEYDFTISHNFINTWIRKRSIKELLRLVKPDDVLLEIGCGTGAEAIQISKKVQQIIATDISQGMLTLLRRKINAKKLDNILPVQVRAARISSIAPVCDGGNVRIAYSFNGALNLEPDIDKFPLELSKVVKRGGYFVCSVRNILCLSETIAHASVLQLDKIAPRRKQPTMVSVGGIDIPAYYYSTRFMSRLFGPYFRLRKLVGLPAFLPPAYLNDYCIRFRPVTSLLEKLETVLAEQFPFNRLSDQTLYVFQRR